MAESEIPDFVIPIDKDELLHPHVGQYFVAQIVPVDGLTKALDAARPAFQKDGPQFILDHFDTFFSVVVHGGKVQLIVILRTFERLLKVINQLICDMETFSEPGKSMPVEDKPLYLCMNKMYAYLLSSLSCYLENYIHKNVAADKNVDKKKKASKKTEGEEEWGVARQKALELIGRWLQLPLQNLWSPPIAEDSFLTCLTEFCYKVLEHSADGKHKRLREIIFGNLGILVQRYNHGITCVVRIIQFVRLYDALAAPLASGVVHMVKTTGCVSFIKELARDITHNDISEADARNISIFLEGIASSEPDLAILILENITDYLGNECYVMRNCAQSVLGSVVLGTLNGENLDAAKREMRDECLEYLEEHLCDVNAYVRSKSLQIFQRLCCESAIPMQRQANLLASVCDRLKDKSANVRKQALQLMRALVDGNPFAPKFDQVNYNGKLAAAKAKLKELNVLMASKSKGGDDIRIELWETLLPQVQKAIRKTFACSSNEEDSSSDEGEEEPREKDNLSDEQISFEEIRQLLLAEDVVGAVQYLQKTCHKIPSMANIAKMSIASIEKYFVIFLTKIFVESENSDEATATEGQRIPDGDENSAANKELQKIKEEIVKERSLVNYLSYCVSFTKELEDSLPAVENLLFSTMASDAVEASTYLGRAYQFGVKNAVTSFHKALFQVASRDQSVRTNIVNVYKEVYLLADDNSQSSRQESLHRVNALIKLLNELNVGQTMALADLIMAWRSSGDLDTEELQVLWEKFSMKIPETTTAESRAALVLLTMAAQAEPNLFASGNLDILIKIGLGPRAKDDLLLARDTCRALSKIQKPPQANGETSQRYANDHAMFQEISALIVDNFTSTEHDGYISFVTDAINVVYTLARTPDAMMKKIIVELLEKSNIRKKTPTNLETEVNEDPEQDTSPNSHSVSRLFYIIGHVAIRQMVYLDNDVYKELTRRNALKDKKNGKTGGPAAGTSNPPGNPNSTPSTRKSTATPTSARQRMRKREQMNSSSSTEETGEETFEGATADDHDAAFITAILENEIVNANVNSLLGEFVPVIKEVCSQPEIYNDKYMQAWGVLALSKMMTVSTTFCVETLQLLVTIMERSQYPQIRANVLVGMNDLITRFPNQAEPWWSHVYGRLSDINVQVRVTCVRVLADLIMREMIRVKGQVSALALCIVDPDKQVCWEAKKVFRDLSHKGNALYNIMPDILSKLTDSETDLEDKKFQEIFKFLLGLIQKDRQVDTIIDKLCSRFILATTEKQWLDLSYCLSLLQFSEKSLRRLMDSLPLLKEKIHHKVVLKSLRSIIEQSKKKAPLKNACTELEEKIADLLKNTEEADLAAMEDRVAMPPPPAPKRRSKNRVNRRRNRDSSSDSSGSDDEEDNADGDENEINSANFPTNTPKKNAAKSTPKRKQATTTPKKPSETTPRAKKNKPEETETPPSRPRRLSARSASRRT